MGIPDEWRKSLRQWASKNDSVRQLWLFGSYAKGTEKPESDVDIAVALMPPKGDHNWALGAYFALHSDWKHELE
jgi:predicted nucleotidyltransferase